MAGHQGRLEQAVILAGGRGTRLGALTETRPKPMVEVNGRPFIDYLVELLRDQGITHIVLLLGHLAETVVDHVGDGERYGIRIDCSVTGADDLTSHRLQVAAPLLDEHFLLLYCDNYWPLRLDAMWEQFVATDVDAQVTVYANDDGWSRSNVAVRDGRVTAYDPSRSAPGLGGVEIGYSILRRDVVLDLLPEEQVLFERAVYPQLVDRGTLGAFVTQHRYHSVGSVDRLPRTARFLARRPAVILDRDGVLNERPPRAEYVTSPEGLRWLPGSLEALRVLREAGYLVLVVTNQAGVGRGLMTAADLDAVHRRLVDDASAAGGRIDGIYHCPHDWDEGCECRKPRPGMLLAAQRDHDLDLSRTCFVGDDERDAEAARLAGCPSILVDEDRGLLDVVLELVGHRAEVAR